MHAMVAANGPREAAACCDANWISNWALSSRNLAASLFILPFSARTRSNSARTRLWCAHTRRLSSSAAALRCATELSNISCVSLSGKDNNAAGGAALAATGAIPSGEKLPRGNCSSCEVSSVAKEVLSCNTAHSSASSSPSALACRPSPGSASPSPSARRGAQGRIQKARRAEKSRVLAPSIESSGRMACPCNHAWAHRPTERRTRKVKPPRSKNRFVAHEDRTF
mmetsp:Transcript_104784/g.263859  ORF Transcript_104784/g.263859 Transcript_104784/m.263859 type:complete len:225 (+) Transcript_104784:697-1371(+)